MEQSREVWASAACFPEGLWPQVNVHKRLGFYRRSSGRRLAEQHQSAAAGPKHSLAAKIEFSGRRRRVGRRVFTVRVQDWEKWRLLVPHSLVGRAVLVQVGGSREGQTGHLVQRVHGHADRKDTVGFWTLSSVLVHWAATRSPTEQQRDLK